MAGAACVRADVFKFIVNFHDMLRLKDWLRSDNFPMKRKASKAQSMLLTHFPWFNTL